MPDDDNPAHSSFVCPACRVIDATDGTADGVMFAPPTVHAKEEHKLLSALSRAQDHAADKITSFAGSLRFVYIHGIWFAVWVAINIGLFGAALKFDEYPFGLLTMIVSLEAIFLSTFVMVSQNREAKRANIRAQLDFETNIRGEIWAIHIGAALQIDPEHVEQVVAQAISATKG
jgi:uncharacterized membrane protein